MPAALGGSAIGYATTASSGTTSAITTTTGSTFVIATADTNAALTVSDSKGNTYAQAGTDQDGLPASPVIGQLWYCQNGTGGTGHTATVTFTSGTGDCPVYFLELTGVASASYDSAVTAQGSDAASPFSVTSGTPTQADEILVCLIGTSSNPVSWTAGGGFTIAQQVDTNSTYWASAIATRVISAASAVTPSFTAGNTLDGTCLIVAGFKASGGSVQAPRSTLLQMLMRNN